MVAHARSPLIVPLLAVVLVARAVFVALVTIALLKPSALITLRMLLLLLLRSLATALTLLLRLIHRVQDTEIVFCVLEKCLGRHPVSAARRVAPKLEIFLKQLLSGAADPDFRPVAVENMVAV